MCVEVPAEKAERGGMGGGGGGGAIHTCTPFLG